MTRKISPARQSMRKEATTVPKIMKGARKIRRRKRFTPVCALFTSCVMRVISVGMPIPSSSLNEKALILR